MLEGVTPQATVESVGDVRAISGKSIIISDKATGLSGAFYITSDTHTFSDGVHTMSLELAWHNVMESVDTGSGKKKVKADLKNSAKCYYLDGSNVYHSSASCTACKGKKTKRSTVGAMKKIRITSGKNKGRRKYKPCSRCWET